MPTYKEVLTDPPAQHPHPTYECDACGCIVVDRDKHTWWHNLPPGQR